MAMTDPGPRQKFRGLGVGTMKALERPHEETELNLPVADSVFTRILRREIPAALVYEDDTVFAFMDAGQLNPGHVLVATRRQVETVMELEEAEAAHLFAVAQRIARVVWAEFRPDGMTLLQANRPAGWQTVPHVHVHVLPRFEGDGVGLVWPRKEPPLDELRAIAARIRV